MYIEKDTHRNHFDMIGPCLGFVIEGWTMVPMKIERRQSLAFMDIDCEKALL